MVVTRGTNAAEGVDVEGHCTTKRVPADDKFVRGVNNRGCFCDLMIPAARRVPPTLVHARNVCLFSLFISRGKAEACESHRRRLERVEFSGRGCAREICFSFFPYYIVYDAMRQVAFARD